MQPKAVTEKICEEIKRLREEKVQALSPEKRLLSSTSADVVKPLRTNSSVDPRSESKPKPTGRRKKNASEDASRKMTLLSLGNISYRDLPQLQGEAFDPADLVGNDDDDPEYEAILRKFEFRSPESSAAPSNLKSMYFTLSSTL